MSTTSQLSAGAAGTFTLGADLTVHRLGYGTMQLPGPGVWGPPADRDEAIAVLRHTVELGINLIDTADAYGPFVTDELIRAALHPYPDELVIATKVGFTRQGPDKWAPVGRPEYLRQQTELNLRNLKVDRLDLLQLHRIDTAVALEDQVGVLKALQDEGKVRHIGLSEVSVDEMKAARKVADIVSVQNQFNFSNRSAEPLLDYCETEGIGFIPWTPLATGDLAASGTPLAAMAQERNHSPSQLVLAWLLKRSPAMLPIPGTSSIKHLEDNIAAANIQLSADEFDILNSAA